MTGAEPAYRHVALSVARSDPPTVEALASATSWLRGDPRVTFSAVHVAPALPALTGGLTEWGAVDRNDPLAPVREWLDEATSSLDAETVVLEGREPAVVASRWAKTSGVDLVVAAASSSLVQRIALGSFTAGLAAHLDVPLLVVPPHPGDAAASWTPEPPKAVVCCLDPSPAAMAAARESERLLAGRTESELTVLHALVPPRVMRPRLMRRVFPAPRKRVHRAHEWLKQAVADLPHTRRALILGFGRDAAEWADRHGADLIVAGARAEHSAPRVIGGFAHDLSLHARVPVLLVPPPPPGRS